MARIGLIRHFACLVIAATPACANDPDAIQTISGQINDSFARRVSSAIETQSRIVISSGGGDPEVAYEVSRSLASWDGEVEIGPLCLSACAEFILPLYPEPRFQGKPLIGFHGNDRMGAWIVGREADPGALYCGLSRAEYQTQAFQKRGWNPGFWKETASRLMIISSRTIQENGCLGVSARYEVGSWFPKTEDLVRYLGFTPAGPLCADDEDCWGVAIPRFMRPGRNFMVGSTVYLMGEDGTYTVVDPREFSGQYLKPD